jgi:preprotein translocase subunit SecY
MKNAFRPLVIIFLMVNALALVFRARLEQKGIDADVVIIGNLILFAASSLSIFMYNKKVDPKRPQAVVQNVYGGFILKFFILAIATMLYCFLAKPINKEGIFVCMGLYLVYNFIGTRQAVKKPTPQN